MHKFQHSQQIKITTLRIVSIKKNNEDKKSSTATNSFFLFFFNIVLLLGIKLHEFHRNVAVTIIFSPCISLSACVYVYVALF